MLLSLAGLVSEPAPYFFPHTFPVRRRVPSPVRLPLEPGVRNIDFSSLPRSTPPPNPAYSLFLLRSFLPFFFLVSVGPQSANLLPLPSCPRVGSPHIRGSKGPTWKPTLSSCPNLPGPPPPPLVSTSFGRGRVLPPRAMVAIFFSSSIFPKPIPNAFRYLVVADFGRFPV